MISHRAFRHEEWALREEELDLEVLAQTESIFALANGHIGLRGNLDEGEPHGVPGSYLGGFHELRELPYAERGYGFPEASQTLVNVTNGKIIRLLVDDEPFDVRYGRMHSHRRVLDLREGVLHREVDWVSPAGARVRVRSTRLVSFAQRAVAAIAYEVEALDAVQAVVQSELVANETLPGRGGDPRSGGEPGPPLAARWSGVHELAALLVHETEGSGLLLAAGMDHVVEGPAGTQTSAESLGDEARVTAAASLAPGERLRIVKLVAYGWSAHRARPALRDQVRAAVLEAARAGWEELRAQQRRYLDAFWARADVEIEGDPELQLAVRFSLFHCLQAAARAEQRGIPAKGLTGPGYSGHTFWDTETFVLPLLTYTLPPAAADALRWRCSTLERARRRARELGLAGAAFPWRTIDGEECSGYWPAGTAAFHVNADIAAAVARYHAAVQDPAFEREAGAEILVETARLWTSLAHRDADGIAHIDGVTGPDEYSALVDDNLYTNLMASANLRAAADAVERDPERAAALGAGAGEVAAWRALASAMAIPYDALRDVHSQAQGSTRLERWDFEATDPDEYPLLLHHHYFDLYRKQVVKQADLVLALHLCGDAFTDEQKARAFEYYEGLTVRDSSLSACTQAAIAAEVGHLELAYDYLAEAALIDLDDTEHNTRDGLHIGALAGTWIAAVAGFGGMRDHGGALSFRPRLPDALTRLAFGLGWRGAWITVEVTAREARYTLSGGAPVAVRHHGEPVTLASERPLTLAIPPGPRRPPPRQPPGRAPARRRAR